jgi:hypothetical protein
MLRFLVGLMIVLGLFCLVWTFLGENAFIWALILGIAVPGLGLLFLPLARRGPEYAYQKWYLWNSIWIILVVVGIGLGWILGIAHLLQESPDPLISAAAVGVVVPIGGFVYLLSVLLTPPTRRRSWLRRRYPAVAAAIKRYMKPGDLLEDYTPALADRGGRYFLIAYHDRTNPDRVLGYLLLDESGRPVRSEEMVKRIGKCKTLAITTIDYKEHQRRLRDINSYRQAISTLVRVLSLLGQDKSRFAELGTEVAADLDSVVGAEGAIRMALEVTISIELLQADWAARHGLGRLTVVNYEDVIALEGEIVKVRQKLVDCLDELATAVLPARRLAEQVERVTSIPERGLIKEGLLAIADLGDGIQEQETGGYDYAHLTRDQWQAWRERMAWADEVDGKMGESAA